MRNAEIIVLELTAENNRLRKLCGEVGAANRELYADCEAAVKALLQISERLAPLEKLAAAVRRMASDVPNNAMASQETAIMQVARWQAANELLRDVGLDVPCPKALDKDPRKA